MAEISAAVAQDRLFASTNWVPENHNSVAQAPARNFVRMSDDILFGCSAKFITARPR